ncbi:hypothetical protein SAMN05216582_11413 [Selenomonas ruminantium]|uniref:Xylose isomerase-like TIM barrel domain-containing protein n=1 Tax=Selenomonas ruminantium TaxID=971 RepID=A0A1M6UQH6_SELRU|nr:TIM barrel protein [Selenomonas ruminantium]SHK71467.1 hypothetical protein SAMN05216582_11413 [Selenomonas ruminantium]
MEILCAPAGLSAWEYPGQGVLDIAGSAFEQAMLDIALLFPVKEFRRNGAEENWLAGRWQAAETFLSKFQQKKLGLPLAYAPHFGYRAADWPSLAVYQDFAERSLRFCQVAGSRYLVLRPFMAEMPTDKLIEVNREFYQGLIPLAREAQVVILLENQARSINGHLVRGRFTSAEETVDFIDGLNAFAGEERFGFCLHMGASGACGLNVYDLLHALSGRLKAVILCDSDATGDRELLPFTGASKGACETDWLNLIRSLREISFDGLLVLDMRDTAAAFPPLLRPKLMEMAQAVLQYILWQIEMEKTVASYPKRVLFGAGRMCRNYMSNYGKEYPPLFTCDNNSRLWGSSVAGLVVHDPKDLLSLPPDCAIFICNIYYREIEAQLRDMGVKNPIEFFNDECLSSLYAGTLLGEGA